MRICEKVEGPAEEGEVVEEVAAEAEEVVGVAVRVRHLCDWL